MKINLCNDDIIYDGYILENNVIIEEMNILYLACALRKVLFDRYRQQYNHILVKLRKVTASYPIPSEIEIIYE